MLIGPPKRWQLSKKALNYNNRKRKHCLRTIWNAILYLMKTGCQWRMLPKDFPKWQLVYYQAANRYFKKWIDLEDFDVLLKKYGEKYAFKKARISLPVLE